MSSVKTTIAAFGLAAAALASPAIAGVVVKASGPSAGQYPVGKKLDDSATVTLKAGDSLTVLTNSGTRVITGPGTQQVGARGASKQTAFAMLTRQRAGARVRTGAVRGPGSAAPSNGNVWNIDVSQAGTVCLPDSETLSFWRPTLDGEETYMIGGANNFHVHVKFDDGDATSTMPAEELPMAGTYTVTGPNGSGSHALTFATLGTAPDNPEDLASALAAKGCTAQLTLLSDKLAS